MGNSLEKITQSAKDIGWHLKSNWLRYAVWAAIAGGVYSCDRPRVVEGDVLWISSHSGTRDYEMPFKAQIAVLEPNSSEPEVVDYGFACWNNLKRDYLVKSLSVGDHVRIRKGFGYESWPEKLEREQK